MERIDALPVLVPLIPLVCFYGLVWLFCRAAAVADEEAEARTDAYRKTQRETWDRILATNPNVCRSLELPVWDRLT